MSVAKITDNVFEVIFRKTKAIVIDAHGNTVMVSKRKNDLYLIPEAKETASVARTRSAKKNPWQDLHEKLGHLNMRDLKSIVENKKMHSVDIKCDKELQK
ncbi:retrovirus-related pol polyprotein from transposon tnt 1-94, partial [Lasius niger]